MTRVIEWIVSLLIVVALFVTIGLFLPAQRTVSHSVETNRPMSTVTDVLDGFVRFKDWNALINRDPRMQLTVSGPEAGVGAKLDYRSNDPVVGSGSWEIVESVPGERIVYALNNRGRGDDKKMTFTFERTGQRKQNVQITQRYTVDYGWDLFGRYAGLYVTRTVGDDIKRGLAKFSNLLATIPRFDYSMHPNDFRFVDVPAANVLVATATAKRSNDEIALAMTNQSKWIAQVMEKNKLEPAGPMRIVTNEFGSDAYGFDVVQPVRPEGTGPADEEGAAEDASDEPADEAEGDAAAAAEGEEAEVDPTAEIAQPGVALTAPLAEGQPLERLDITIEGDGNPVVYMQQPATRAAVTTYVGPSPGLPRVRDLVRAWAIVHGAETGDRPYEDYRDEIKDMLAEDAEFQVYWPVKVGGAPVPMAVQLVPEPVSEDEGSAPPTEGAPAEDAEAEDAEAETESAE